MTSTTQSELPPSFNVPGLHSISRFGVFTGSWGPRFLGLLAISPMLLFPIELTVFLTLGMPYFIMVVTIISMPFMPIFAYVLATFWHTSIVYVWRSYYGTAVLCQEPWRKSDLAQLPAAAWQRAGASQSLVPVIDALTHEISEVGLRSQSVTGHEFNPYRQPQAGADDELVSMVLRTEAATKVYSARQEKDRYHTLKVSGMFILIGFLAFVIWLTLSDMNSPPRA